MTPTTPRVYLWASGAGPGTTRSGRVRAQATGSRSPGRSPMSTTVTDPARCRAGGTTSAGLSTPKHTVTSARMAGPATCPVSVSTPLGTSTATTGTPDARTTRTTPAAGSRTAPRRRCPGSRRGRGPRCRSRPDVRVVPGQHPGAGRPGRPGSVDVHPVRIADDGRGYPPACEVGQRPQGIPAVVARPDQGDHPRPRTRPRLPRSRSRQIPARAVDARCISTGSGTPAPASARRTASTEQIGRISTSAIPDPHLGPTHAGRQPGLSVPPVTLVTCATVPPGTALEVAESRPLRYFPNQGGSGGPRYHWVSHGPHARRNPRGPGSTRRTTGRGLPRMHERAHGIRQLTSQAMRNTR